VVLCWAVVFFTFVGIGENDDPSFFWGLLVVPLISVSCYTVYSVIQPSGRRLWHPIADVIKHVAVVCCLLVASVYVTYAAHWLFWDPIECPGAALESGDVAVIANHEGDVVSVHRSSCEIGLFTGSDAQYYFAFVRHQRESNRTDNLALRYDTDDSGWKQPPRVEWLDEKTVRITIASRVYAVTQDRTRVNGIRVVYRFRRTDYVTNVTAWQRLSTQQI